ncbi:right-handed parallel beta-helix repeat-containing protein [Engelhardtia mirabilis]|uniref:Right handed beta helix domain-containing protein n=1 Tax=Engelhardtia mirabilis TaxID=2528011 RepID=A0A518BRT0_9BACT|nr:hypothetical protein Pla133_48060 [Planctomycetes bacterium Pla133]QDV04011.1 hypothetical protein Pla86_48040 [Planctomycetes bacterium Pla86]
MRLHTTLPLVVASLAAPALAQSTITVAKDGSGNFLSISAAISSASSGDRIEVLDSEIYREEFDLGIKDLEIVGVATDPPMIIPPSVHTAPLCTIAGGQSSATLLQNLQFGDDLFGSGSLGGSDHGALVIRESAPRILECDFFQNGNGSSTFSDGVLGSPTLDVSGAISSYASSPFISDCYFAGNNSGTGAGGAIRIIDNLASGGTAVIANSLFLVNESSERGGAVFVWGDVSTVIAGNEFYVNVCAEDQMPATDPVGGGSIAVIETGESPVVIRGNLFGSSNAFTNGGAVLVYEAEVAFQDNQIEGDVRISAVNPTSKLKGGGVCVMSGSASFFHDAFAGCFSEGRGGALAIVGESAVTVTDCSFIDCEARSGGAGEPADGGGVYVHHSDVEVDECYFEGCSASSSLIPGNPGVARGGAVSIRNPGLNSAGIVRVKDCEFRDNQAADLGGAVFVTATDAVPGGGLGKAIVRTSQFFDNGEVGVAPAEGGAIYASKADVEILRNELLRNYAAGGGGGVRFDLMPSGARIDNNLIARCEAPVGSGMWIQVDSSFVSITSNTLANCVGSTSGGSGSALYVSPGGNLIIFNTISWNHTGGSIAAGNQAQARTYNCCIEADANNLWTSVSNDIFVDPLFVNLLGDDYHLTQTSPCVDTGNSTTPLLTNKDIDGDPRISGALGMVDRGADEVHDAAGI